jgi:hypothetical protein
MTDEKDLSPDTCMNTLWLRATTRVELGRASDVDADHAAVTLPSRPDHGRRRSCNSQVRRPGATVVCDQEEAMMKYVARLGMALAGALALTLLGCNGDISGPPAWPRVPVANKGGNPHSGGGGGSTSGSTIAVRVTMTDTAFAFTDQAVLGTITPALTSDGLGSYDGTVDVGSSDPNGRLAIGMQTHGRGARCANISLTLVSGSQADLPQAGCETVTMYTNSRNGEGCSTCNANGFTDLTTPGDTALQGGSVRWPNGTNDEWVVVLDPSQTQLDACAANGIATSDLSPRGQGVLVRLVSNNVDGTRTWSVEPLNVNGHLYGVLRTVNGSQCIAVVTFPFQLSVTG